MTLVLVDRLRGERNATAQVVVLFAAIAAVFADAPKQHAFVLAQDLRGLLFGIEPWDPLSQGVTIALLGAVAVAATWIPARRAMRLDPATVLRME